MDSPFARLTDLMIEVVEDQKLPIPRALIKVGLTFQGSHDILCVKFFILKTPAYRPLSSQMVLAVMKRSIKKKAGFDIEKASPCRSILP